MFKLVRSTMLALTLTATAAGAFPMHTSRYVDEKSGYIVQTADVGGWLRVSGRHPETGKTFKVKVSRDGRVVGDWNGKAVDYVMNETPSDVQLAQTSVAAAGAK